jgi:hypothetical protein
MILIAAKKICLFDSVIRLFFKLPNEKIKSLHLDGNVGRDGNHGYSFRCWL